MVEGEDWIVAIPFSLGDNKVTIDTDELEDITQVEQLELQLSSQQKILDLWKELVNAVLDSLQED